MFHSKIFIKKKPFVMAITGVFTMIVNIAWADTNKIDSLPPHLGALHVTPANVAVGRQTLVTVSVRLKNALQPEFIILRQLDGKTQKPVGTLSTFEDDGKNGDRHAQDGVYTTQFQVFEPSVGKFFMDAFAVFKQDEYTRELRSFRATITVKNSVEDLDAYAIADPLDRVFLDKDGRMVTDLADEITAKKNGRAALNQNQEEFVVETSNTSLNQKYMSISGCWVPGGAKGQKGEDEETGRFFAREFQYADKNGVLWSKRTVPPRRFYIADSDSQISEDGSRILVVETGPYDGNAVFEVRTNSGEIILSEKLPMGGLTDARISENGRFILFEGSPLQFRGDYRNFVVIEVDKPSNKWIKEYRLSHYSSESIENNVKGGFDVIFDGMTKFSFPE